MQVMIAVADADLRLALEIHLAEEPGLYLAAATTGAVATAAILPTVRPDLLFLSWRLCEIGSGVSPADIVRLAAAQEPPCDVVALSGDDNERCEALAAGVSAVVSAWDPPGTLVETIRSVRARRSRSERNTFRPVAPAMPG